MCASGPQQLPKTSKFYSKCKKCDIDKTLRVGTTPPSWEPEGYFNPTMKKFEIYAENLVRVVRCGDMPVIVFGIYVSPFELQIKRRPSERRNCEDLMLSN